MTKVVSVILKEELNQLHQDIVKRHEQAGQVATGKTRDSFGSHLTGDLSGVVVGAPYVGVLERGRGPARSVDGTEEEKEAFIEGLKEWILAKGLDYGGTPEGLEILAGFFRWYLNEFGSWQKRFGYEVDIFSTPIDEFTNRLGNRVSVAFENEIRNDIFKAII